MQVELSKDNLDVICTALYRMKNTESELLANELMEKVEELEELESIDLNDCAGGACKL